MSTPTASGWAELPADVRAEIVHLMRDGLYDVVTRTGRGAAVEANLARAFPAIERAVRAQVADEIGARRDTLQWDEMFTVFDAYTDAQGIARGRSR